MMIEALECTNKHFTVYASHQTLSILTLHPFNTASTARIVYIESQQTWIRNISELNYNTKFEIIQ